MTWLIALSFALLRLDQCAAFTALPRQHPRWSPAHASLAPDATEEQAGRPKGLSELEGYTAGAIMALRDVSVGVADNTLISKLNWNILPNERWAIVGTNGCGKSTLLKAVTGTLPELIMGGSVKVMPGMRMGYLEQTAVSGASSTVKQEVMSRMTAYQAALKELEAAEAGCVSGEACELERLDAATSAFEAAGGYTVEGRVSTVLKGLGFEPADYDQPCDSFSGGWQMRIALARLLLSEPDLLVLDEPTNHLDASARRWLGTYVAAYEGTVLLVSHDLEMLRVACNSIAEVRGGEVETYKTMGYDKFLVEREERAARALAEYAAMERERAKMQDFVDRMGAKASKATQAQDRLKKLAKLEEQMVLPAFVEEEQGRRGPSLSLAKPPPCGQWPIKLNGASFGYATVAKPGGGGGEDEERVVVAATDPERCVVRGCDLAVERGMRMVVRGPNGAGKSTLLKALTGALPLAEGTRTEDERLSLGLFAQDLAQELPGHVAAVDYVTDVVRQVDPLTTTTAARTVMGSLGLTGAKATRPIGTLSGGEKARVALATFCMTPHNLLLLDEPTNHLDQEAIKSLLDALSRYEGAVLVVSHDRPFCEAIAATHVAYVSGGSVAVQERGLKASDWSESDKGHRQVGNQVLDASEAVQSGAQAVLNKGVPKMYSGGSTAASGGGGTGGTAGGEPGAAQAVQAPPPPLEGRKKAAVAPEKKKKAAAPKLEGSAAAAMGLSPEALAAAREGAKDAHYSEGKAAASLAAFEKAEAAAKQAAAKSRALPKKRLKALRDECAALEEEVALTEGEAVRLAAKLEASRSRTPRPTYSEAMELAAASSAARRLADDKLERWVELEEMLEGQEEA